MLQIRSQTNIDGSSEKGTRRNDNKPASSSFFEIYRGGVYGPETAAYECRTSDSQACTVLASSRCSFVCLGLHVRYHSARPVHHRAAIWYRNRPHQRCCARRNCYGRTVNHRLP